MWWGACTAKRREATAAAAVHTTNLHTQPSVNYSCTEFQPVTVWRLACGGVEWAAQGVACSLQCIWEASVRNAYRGCALSVCSVGGAIMGTAAGARVNSLG